MSIENYRKSAVEMGQDACMNQMYMALSLLVNSLRTTLPHAPIPDVNSLFYGRTPVISAAGQVTLSGPALIEGRGPRFCAKYNLARSDSERQELLDSLHKFNRPSTIQWSERLEEYRTTAYPHAQYYGLGNYRPPAAQEIGAWLQTRVAEGRFFQLTSSTGLEDLVPLLVGPEPNSDNIEISSEILLVETGVVDGQVDPTASKYVLLPSPEAQSYAVYLLRTVMRHEEACMQAESVGNILWSTHELAWAVMGSNARDGQPYDAAMQRWLDEMGYPPFVEVADWEMMKVAYEALDHLKEHWLPDLLENRDLIEERSFTVEGCLQLIVAPSHSERSYDNWRFECMFLDTPEDIECKSNFSLCWENGYGPIVDKLLPFFYHREERDSNSGKAIQKTLQHHPRQYARIRDLLIQFMVASTEELVVETKLRDSNH